METRSHGEWSVYEAIEDDEEAVGLVEDLAAAAADAPDLEVREEHGNGRVMAAVRPARGCAGCDDTGLTLTDVLRFLDDLLEWILIGLGLGALWGLTQNRGLV